MRGGEGRGGEGRRGEIRGEEEVEESAGEGRKERMRHVSMIL